MQIVSTPNSTFATSVEQDSKTTAKTFHKVVQMGKSNSLSRLIHSELRNQLSLSMQFKPCIRVTELTQPVKMRDHFIYNFISIKAFLLMLITFWYLESVTVTSEA